MIRCIGVTRGRCCELQGRPPPPHVLGFSSEAELQRALIQVGLGRACA